MNEDYEIVITEDSSATVLLKSSNITFHSKRGAVQESRHVFIKNGLQYMMDTKPSINSIKIFEIGFGTGLNALLTAKEAAKNNTNIVYYSIDKYPLPRTVYTKLNYAETLMEPELYNEIMITGWDELMPVSSYFKLQKIQSDFNVYTFTQKFDILYLDAFAPEDAPDLWTENNFSKMFAALNNDGLLVTYCSKSSIRKLLQNVGFSVEKLPGPPGKREVIRAIKL